eukprot:CAMPEP_0114633308 /NCGR_PEP_ID=MMETSP0168-20121206/15386_1 /TAXON_ID=95228 ORGANISM="Vannella sp., Strain DIVA3 517/6/12" /NCGR_SAMPLE_ID=MMETSP0168 /ASSEMBLY_ACC=CAM_ASM_000044 /LENGTH=115 /DNA_ID=CAMNT_0001844951 /DNA_START=22 /DNA_END=369 /DNA_ORIENTATION=+
MANFHYVSLHPYLEVLEENKEKLEALLPKLVEASRAEPGCTYYDVTRSGNKLAVRAQYKDADAFLAHRANVNNVSDEVNSLCKILRVELHGPAAEVAKLQEALGKFTPEVYTVSH